MPNKRAWCVGDHEGYVIVFAETKGKARFDAAMELGLADYAPDILGLRVRRAPTADPFVGGEVPDWCYIDVGCWVPCAACGVEVYSFAEGDESPVAVGKSVIHKGCEPEYRAHLERRGA